MNNRLLGSAALCLLLGMAACGDQDGPVAIDPGAGSGQIPTPRVLTVLGQGAVAERFTSELTVHNGWAYTGTWGQRGAGGVPGNALKIWDVRGNTPVLVDSIIVEQAITLGDVQVSDDGRLLVVATERSPGSIVIYDLVNPARPRQIARFSNDNTRPGVHTAEVARVNGRLYAFLSVDPSPAQLVIVDLGDPANPREVFAQPMGNPFIHDVFVRDGLLFTALWNNGTTIWDIGGGGRGGSPANPVQISNIRTVGGKVHNIWWFHDPVSNSKRYMFVGEEGPGTGAFGSSSSGDIHVVDVSDLANPREVAFFTVTGAGTHNFSVDEPSGFLYAAYYNGGVRVLDVRGDLGTCEAAAKSQDGRCNLQLMGREAARGLLDRGMPVFVWGVQHVGAHLYASDMLNGLWKLESLRR
jgi:hypothetical protein